MGQASIESETPNTPLPFCPLAFFFFSRSPSSSRLSGGERSDVGRHCRPRARWRLISILRFGGGERARRIRELLESEIIKARVMRFIDCDANGDNLRLYASLFRSLLVFADGLLLRDEPKWDKVTSQICIAFSNVLLFSSLSMRYLRSFGNGFISSSVISWNWN